ncbi:hypothetical protein LCGC14_2982990, partial [marine sediment metagenome]
MFKKRFTMIVFCVLLIAVFAISFSGGKKKKGGEEDAAVGETSKRPEDMKGTVLMYKGPFGPNEVELHNKIIVEFNKIYPNIKVTFETFDWPTME